MKLEELLNLSYFQMTRILLSAVELDFFPLLIEPHSASDVAAKRDLDARATPRILNALVGLGVLTLNDGKYVVPEELRDALGDGPGSVVPMFRHRARLWKTWSSLTEVVRTGRTHYDLHDPEFNHWEGLSNFTRAMVVSGRKLAAETVSEIDLDGVTRVLDIGGGPGVYAIEFCKARPDINVCILDREGVHEVASEIIEGQGCSDRISFIHGNAIEMDVDSVTSDGKFDLIFMSNLIHAIAIPGIIELFRRCTLWCSPGAKIVIKDFFLDDTRTKPQQAAVFAINMLVGTSHGDSYTWNETEGWLNDLVNADNEQAVTGISRVLLSDKYSGMIVAQMK